MPSDETVLFFIGLPTKIFIFVCPLLQRNSLLVQFLQFSVICVPETFSIFYVSSHLPTYSSFVRQICELLNNRTIQLND